MASYGLTNQVLTLYLKALDIPETMIGLFMTLTLIGDTFISYWLTWYSDRIGRRNVMYIGAVLMVMSGAVFASPLSANFLVLLIAAILGVISPSGDETGPFKSVEEASIAHITPLYHRAEVYAIHGMMGTMGSAIGSVGCGFIVDFLNNTKEWPILSCYKFAFCIYSVLALGKLIIMLFLSEKCEIQSKPLFLETPITEEELVSSAIATEGSPLLYDHHDYDYTQEEDNSHEIPTKTWTGLSNQSHTILSRLLVIFMIDSFGYGFMTPAWVVYYFKLTFGLAASTLGLLFFCTNISNAVSSIPSLYLAKKFGPVVATLLTQTPSGLFFMLIPLLSFNFILSSISLLLYSITVAMDVVPRQILLTTLIKHDELTRVLGIVNIGKTLARCVGPLFTGKLLELGMLWVCYIISGCSVFISGAILVINFKGIDRVVLHQQRLERSFH